jgi:type II secretory pathway pseudopilin PulG
LCKNNEYLLFIERQRRAAFSLVEILVAIFVLSIGLIMIAGIFPVAVKWTADDAQTSIAQVIAKNAVATIETEMSNSAPPILTQLTYATSGVYAFGNSQPYPASNPGTAVYSWSAYLAPAPGVPGTNTYLLYVFIFSNPNPGQSSYTVSLPNQPYGTPTTPIAGIPAGNTAYPQVFEATWASLFGTGSTATANPNFPVGAIGVDISDPGVNITDDVFRLIVNTAGNLVPTGTGIPNTNDEILFAPPAIGQTASPLIYIYVTTVSL